MQRNSEIHFLWRWEKVEKMVAFDSKHTNTIFTNERSYSPQFDQRWNCGWLNSINSIFVRSPSQPKVLIRMIKPEKWSITFLTIVNMVLFTLMNDSLCEYYKQEVQRSGNLGEWSISKINFRQNFTFVKYRLFEN